MQLNHADFCRLFKLHFNELMRFVVSYVNDVDIAKDIVHDVFLQLWNNRKQMDVSYSLKTYLFTLCRNRALNYLKHEKIVRDHEERLSEWFANENNIVDEEEFEQKYLQIKRSLETLPQKQHEVLYKFYVDGDTYAQIADKLNINVSTVKTHLSRGIEKLKEKFREEIVLWLCFRRN
ncbi:MAG: RNA polymerase sigma factor [Marinifilaceae bacterium]